MNLYDRYIDKTVSENDLPSQIDFGRYCMIGEGEKFKDVTYSNLQTKKTIHQELLLEKNKSLQDIFIDIGIDTERAGNDDFDVIPLIRRIKNKLGLNEFEKLLYEKVFHLEEIFRAPHYLLERVIEKVHVSRAKRIPSKSYQYLASHTEDWIHKSIVSFKPSRILNEELELNFDIYENQLTVSFLERCLVYLNSRLKEIQDLKSFLANYEKLLKNRDDEKGWHKKINRNLSLIGEVYEDDHFTGNIKIGPTLTETEKTLNQINKRLLLLRKGDLFDLVNKRVNQSVTLRNTNVLVNHKHYRYVKSLWIELENVKPEKSESEKLIFEQDVLNGLRAYGKSLVTYSLKNNLDYELKGNYKGFTGQNLILSGVEFKETIEGVFLLEIGKYKIKIVTVANFPNLDDNIISIPKSQHTIIFYYDELLITTDSRFVQINPLDPDSLERVGICIRKYLLMAYLDNVHKEYPFKSSLRDFVKYIPTQFIDFNPNNYTYNFHSYPKTRISLEEIRKRIENDQVFKTKSRPDRDSILASITELINNIDSNAVKLKSEYMNCFNCGEKHPSHNIESLDYIKCPTCSCLIDTSNPEEVIMKINDARWNSLVPEAFGIDYLNFNRFALNQDVLTNIYG